MNVKQNSPPLPQSSDEFTSWAQVEPYVAALLATERTHDNVHTWLAQWTALMKLVRETDARCRIATLVNPADEAAQARLTTFYQDIQPAWLTTDQKLKQLLLDNALQPSGMETPLEKLRVEASLFCMANVPLLSEELQLGNLYNQIIGAQITLASDAAGALYALWNAGVADKGPERIYFAKSTDGGATWSSKAEVSTAPVGVSHAFPAIAAGAAGDIRISWMNTRAGVLWNTYYRRSSDGGATWSAEADLSSYVAGFDYIQPNGFTFPFGDYYELDIDGRGDTHVIWGEGLNYEGPGSIWYTRGN